MEKRWSGRRYCGCTEVTGVEGVFNIFLFKRGKGWGFRSLNEEMVFVRS